MLDFLFKKQEINKSEIFNNLYGKMRELYTKDTVTAERKKELGELIEKFGYLPYSQIKVLEELSDAEVIYCLEKKLEINETFKDNKLIIQDNKISRPLSLLIG